MKECPKDGCFNWIPPGGAADMSGKIHQTLQESFSNGDWKSFPDGGCSCPGKCVRLHEDGDDDYFEPNDPEDVGVLLDELVQEAQDLGFYDPPGHPCRRCKGSGVDPDLNERSTSGGHDDRSCKACGGEGVRK